MSRGVIFDMDGVLVDSGAAHAESWRVMARQHGVEISDELFRSTFGRPSRDIIRIIWGDDLTDAQIQAYDDEKEDAYRRLIAGAVPLMPGCRELLARLSQAGLVLAVATSGPRGNLEAVVNEMHIGPFAATVTGFDIEHGKPAPDCFLLAAQRARLAPADAVVVEDAPVGIQAAIAAGMPAIGLTGTHPAERLREAGAVVAVDVLDDITPALVNELLDC